MTKVQTWLMRFSSVALFCTTCLSRFIYFGSIQSLLRTRSMDKVAKMLQFLFPYAVAFGLQGLVTYTFFLNPPKTRANAILRHGAVLIVVTASRTYATLGNIDAAATWDWVLGYWAVTVPILFLVHGIVQLIIAFGMNAFTMKKHKNHKQFA